MSQGEIGFGRVGGLITSRPVSFWEKASTQAPDNSSGEAALTIELWDFLTMFWLYKELLAGVTNCSFELEVLRGNKPGSLQLYLGVKGHP